jgi:hypothetical protein
VPEEWLQDDVGDLKGIVLEQRYCIRALAYFSRLLHRLHTVTDDELGVLLEEAITPSDNFHNGGR